MKPKLHEKGQALILIALAAVGLFAFASLAIDGSMVYSVKRRAQNAADAAALSAALAKTRHGDWHTAGINSTLTNSFNNDGTQNTVEVYECTDPSATCTGLPAGADPSEYIQVKIAVNVTTYFTRVLGRDQIATAVEAIARSVPGYNDEMVFGNAVVALNQTDCRAFWGHGGADFTTEGGGVFVNSDSSCGFTLNGGPSLNTPSVTIVGSTSSPVVSGANYNAGQLPYPPMVLPDPDCGTATATQVGNAMTPGRWTGAFPPNGVTHLSGGIYCINGEFRLNGNDTLTGHEIVIRMDSGGISWNGNGVLELSAPPEGPYQGLLIFFPMSNSSTIKINGTNDQKLTGSILAPAAPVVLLGNAGTEGFNSQIIGNTVEFGGTFNGTIHYDDTQNFKADVPPTVQLTK